MASCAHCGQDTIGILSKGWSFRAAPASCRACGGLSYLPAFPVSTRRAAFEGLGVVAAGIVALLLGSIWPLALWVVLTVLVLLVDVLRFLKTPMVATSPAQRDEAGRMERTGLLLMLAAGIAIVLGYWIYRSVS